MPSSRTIEETEKVIKGGRKRSVKTSIFSQFTAAAITLILKQDHAGFSLLFIKRPENSEDVFSGHMAFPGGKMEEEDKNTLATAIRETFEETGIDLNKCGRIIGELDDLTPNNPGASHYVVTPYVAILTQDTELTPNEEVAEIMWIPLSHLGDQKNSAVKAVKTERLHREEFTFHYRGYVIWGMTARVLHNFLSLVGHLFTRAKAESF